MQRPELSMATEVEGYLRLTQPPTNRRHQLPLPPINARPATIQSCPPPSFGEVPAGFSRDYLRLLLSPTIRRHQLRLLPVNTRPTTVQRRPPPLCEKAKVFPTDYLRLTLSPTVRRHQLRLHPINTGPTTVQLPPSFEKVRCSPNGKVPTSFHLPAEAFTCGVSSGNPPPGFPPINTCPTTVQPRLPPSFEEVLHAVPRCSPNGKVPTSFHLPPPEAFTCGVSSGNPPPGRSSQFLVEDSFPELPALVRWKLAESCDHVLQGLLHDVTKEMRGTSVETTTPEDVSLWTDIVTATEAFGLDVAVPKKLLKNKVADLVTWSDRQQRPRC